MVGQPLHYYHPYGDTFSYFQQFEPMEHNEDYPMITSPTNSTQSDSDNSISSIEVPSHSIEIPKKDEKKQCLWRNCGVLLPSLTELANHVAQCHSTGGPDGLFHCGWEGCARNDRGFNARYKMLVHVRTHTNEKPHRCFQCDKSFSRAENLKIHSRSHSGEKPYVCPVEGCGKAYSNSSDRFKHTRTHSVEKPYQCKVPGCPKRYTDPSSLRKHVKTYKHYAVSLTEATETDSAQARLQPVIEREPEASENNTNSTPHARETVENHVPVITSMDAKKNDEYHMHSPTRGDEMFRFRALIDIKTETYGFVDRCQSQKLYRPYEIESDRLSMDVDAPLDLSVRREL